MQFCPRWDVVEAEFNIKDSGHYESLFALGNGYLGARGVTEEAYLDRTPGTYLAGLFDAVPREVTELPNLPDWISLEIDLAGERFDLNQGQVLEYYRVLRLREGVLERLVRWQSPRGRVTKLRFLRFVSLHDQHVAGLKVEVTPENYAGKIAFLSRLDGQVTNSGTQHLAPVEASTFGERGIYLVSESYEQKHLIVQGASHRTDGTILRESFANGPRRIDYTLEVEAKQAVACTLEKLVTTYSSRDLKTQKSKELLLQLVIQENDKVAEVGFAKQQKEHTKIWEERWRKADITIKGPDFDQLALRFAIFHLIQMASWHDYRVSVAAKGLTGEGYRGHVFWDTEIFILPFFLHIFPEVARLQLRYRHHTLPGALRKAKENGYEGAMFAWESADTGDETTPKVGAIDFKTKKPVPILCGDIEQHITADIAYAIAQYVTVTDDLAFLRDYGAEIVLLGARFWASRVEYNQAEDYYEIKNVIGPDEYKEHVDNNYYTNFLAQKQLRYALSLLGDPQYAEVVEKWQFTLEEAKRWEDIIDKLRLPRTDDLLEQFEGFLDLKEIDVLKYRDTPGALQKVYSWREINASQVLKQADVVMLLHLFYDRFTVNEKKTNWEFYEPKTMHDSSLSAAMHSIVASDLGLRNEAYAYFQKASRIDLGNALLNSGHGLHAASLGGLWQATIHGFAGIRIKDQALYCNPQLPQEWQELTFHLELQGTLLEVQMTHAQTTIEVLSLEQPVRGQIGATEFVLDGETRSVTCSNRAVPQ